MKSMWTTVLTLAVVLGGILVSSKPAEAGHRRYRNQVYFSDPYYPSVTRYTTTRRYLVSPDYQVDPYGRSYFNDPNYYGFDDGRYYNTYPVRRRSNTGAIIGGAILNELLRRR